MNDEIKEEPEHPKTNKQTAIFTAIATTLAIIFLLAMIFFLSRPQAIEKEKIEYNYFTFVQEAGLWETTLKRGEQEYQILLRFNPQQVEDVPFNGSLSREFFKPPIYITFDPDSPPENMKYLALGAAELSLNVVRALNLDVIAACTKNITETCAERPILTCNNTDVSIIYIKTGEPEQVIMDGKCITLQGKDFGLLKSIDRLLYHWYGIINPLEKQISEQFDAAIQRYINDTEKLHANES